jgi:hypothetical protein
MYPTAFGETLDILLQGAVTDEVRGTWGKVAQCGPK